MRNIIRLILIPLALILFLASKGAGRLFMFHAKMRYQKRRRRLEELEQYYRKNPNELRFVLWEQELLRQKSAADQSQMSILKQQIEKKGHAHSCFCSQLAIIKHTLEYNIGAKDLENLFKYSSRTIQGWITNLKKFGLLGLIPRGQLPWSIRNQTSPENVRLIWQIHDENPSWGKLRIAQTLWKLFVFIAPNTIRNILNRPRPKKRPWISRQRPSLGTHLGKIIAKAKNAIWSIDLHTVMIGPYQCHILAILDHYSRKVLQLDIYFGEPGSNWVINQIRSTIAFYGKPRAIITDHGSQFISHEFNAFTHNFGIEPRKGKVGMPYSNGKVERFFGTLKRELLNQFPVRTAEKVGKLLKDYKRYYNEHRPHQALDGAGPEDTYEHDRIAIVRPPKTWKTLPKKIKKIKFCQGTLTSYIAA